LRAWTTLDCGGGSTGAFAEGVVGFTDFEVGLSVLGLSFLSFAINLLF
jgi:hypothetical protein